MYIFFILLIFFGINETIAKSNTVLPIMELIANNGYPVEEHFVKTSDDYILRFHRIPHGKNNKNKKRKSKPILLMHGLLCNSAVWVIPTPEKGFGYILADAGYDVWMGNNRGNTYSRNHTTLNPNSSSLFWSFSFHEMGLYDMPAMVDYILLTTNQTQLYQIGHSQGNSIFYVMASMLPEYNDKIAAHFSLAPVAYLTHMKSIIVKFVGKFTKPLGLLVQLLRIHEFIPHYKIFDLIGDYICADGDVTQPLCTGFVYLICGDSPAEQNSTLFPLIFDYTPGDGSIKQLLHFGQLSNSKDFIAYDDNLYGNLQTYGSISQPSYNLSAVTAAVYIFCTTSDLIVSNVDAEKLSKKLPNLKELILVTHEGIGHLNYMFGKNADKYIYHPIVNIINSLE